MSLRTFEATVVRNGKSILDAASLALRSSELIAVVGPNGAGKSTLLNVLAGDIAPDSGSVSLDSRLLAGFSLRELASRRAVVGAPPSLAFDFTVRDVVAMGWTGGVDKAGLNEKEIAIVAILEATELRLFADRIYMTLSSGEKQRVEYARAVLQLWRPVTSNLTRWLLLDEPTANLDVANAIGPMESLKNRALAGDGVFAVVHDLDLAARFADRLVLMEEGKLVAVGRPEDVLEPARLSEIYGTPIHVETHRSLKRLVVIS